MRGYEARVSALEVVGIARGSPEDVVCRAPGRCLWRVSDEIPAHLRAHSPCESTHLRFGFVSFVPHSRRTLENIGGIRYGKRLVFRWKLV